MKKQDETCSLASSTPSSYPTQSSLRALVFSNVLKPSSSVTRVPDNTQTPAQLPSRHFPGLSILFHRREGSMLYYEKVTHYQGISFCYFSVLSSV